MASVVVGLVIGIIANTPLLAAASQQSLAQSEEEIRSLEPGKSIERDIAPGQTHTYRLRLETEQFFHVILEQRGIDVALSMTDPLGTQSVAVDSPNGPYGPESISLVSETAGEYRLFVKADAGNVAPRRYHLKADEVRTPTPADRAHAQATLLIAEAMKQIGGGTAASFRTAIAKYEESLPLWRQAGDKRQEANSLYNLGYLNYALNVKQKPQEYFTQAAAIAHEIGDAQDEASSLTGLGWIQDSVGERQKALEYYFRALPVHRSAGNLYGESGTLSSIGKTYAFMDEHQKALESYKQSLPLRRQSGDLDGEAVTLHGIGIIYNNIGEYQQALNYFNAALKIRLECNDIRPMAASYQVIGGIYAVMGEATTALEYYNLALPLMRKAGSRIGEAYVLSSMSHILRALGKRSEALDYYQQALKLFRDLGDRVGQSSSLNSLGVLASEMNEQQKALEYFNEALTLSRVVKARRNEAVVLGNLGGIALSQGDVQKAIQYNQQALQLCEAIRDLRGQAASFTNLARAENKRGNLVEARSKIEAALKIMETLRTNVDSSTLRSSYLAASQDHYAFYISVLMQQHRTEPMAGHAATALEVNERAHARNLLEMLNEAQADIRAGVDPVLLNRERQLQQKLNAKANDQMKLLSGNPTTEQAAAADREIQLLSSQLDELHTQIRTSSPRYAALTQPQPLKLADMQQLLDDNSLLLEYALGDEQSWLWVVGKNSVTSYPLPSGAEITSAARRVYESFSTGGGAADKAGTEAALKLSRTLLGPVADQLGNKRLLFVTDGILQYLPFGALPDPVTHGKAVPGRAIGTYHPLITKHEIVSLPSASTLAILRSEQRSRRAANQVLAVLADPVFDKNDPRVKPVGETLSSSVSPVNPVSSSAVLERSARDAGLSSFVRLQSTRREAAEITAFAPVEKTFRALDFAASRATAMSQEVGRYRILHFATHGILNTQHPELSGLVLSLINEQGLAQEGFLRAHEVYNLKLNAELVVLSGCQTALGKEIKGEGLIGLTRGFMYAGTPRVLASVWRIPDRATAELMKQFYKALLVDKKSPAGALRTAQIRMLKDPQWSAPYYWAAFTLQGEWQ